METSGLELALGLNPTRFVELGGLDWNFFMTYYSNESEVTELTVDPYNSVSYTHLTLPTIDPV